MRKISKAGISFAAAAVLVAGVAGVGVTQANAASTHLRGRQRSPPRPLPFPPSSVARPVSHWTATSLPR